MLFPHHEDGNKKTSDKPSSGLLRHCSNIVKARSGVVLEFGVWKAKSLRILADSLPADKIYGFDSFEGFPCDGRIDKWDFDFSLPVAPTAPSNVALIQGYFSNTLPQFLYNMEIAGIEKVKLVHIDCDLYSSTRDALFGIRSVLHSGAVIVFDEIMNHDRFLENELLAFFEFLYIEGFDYRCIGAVSEPMEFDEFVQLEENGEIPTTMVEFRRLGYFQAGAVQLQERGHRPASWQNKFVAEAQSLSFRRPVMQPLSKMAMSDVRG